MLHVVGVRHHSPACARLVAHVIREVRPQVVLIEGPSDMNGRQDELLLGHTLPIAIFSYAQGEDLHHASWSPFCAYSPEWVAALEAKKAGAEALFMDLPAWDEAFIDVENRYSDRHTRVSQRMTALCDRLGIEDTDALWDHLFEQPLEMDDLRTRLETYFRELREGDQALGRDITREAYMRRWIAWALANADDVVVVCGGYHAPALAGVTAKNERPEVPVRAGAARTGSYLVPYSFRRLDSFVGYESGMPSPEFYQQVWESGANDAGESMLFTAIQHLRKKKQVVSPADAIAAMTLARGLKMIRGHAELARVDVLDGLAGAVVKDALEKPLPWNRRGTLLRGTDPMLVEIVAAFSGDRTGKLAKGTPHPPLVADAFAELERVGVPFENAAKNVSLTLTEPAGLERSRVLHRLRVLGLPGLRLVRAPSFDRDRTTLTEGWSIQRTLEAEPTLIEAAAYGATLEGAAAAKLEEAIGSATGIAVLAKQLQTAALVGIATLASRLAADVRRAAGIEPSFRDLGSGLADLLVLHEHDVILGAKNAPIVGEAIRAAFERGLWLVEGVDGDTNDDDIRAVVALRNALRQTGEKLGLDPARANSVMQRRAHAADAPAALRGAAYGFMWSMDGEIDGERAIKSAAQPTTLGDFLAGLFALAREEVLRVPNLIGVIDKLVTPMTREDFLLAIPSLRMAFAWFPPREKEDIARAALALHGGNAHDAQKLLKLDVQPAVTVGGIQLDAKVDEIVERFGLGTVGGEEAKA